jgi:hypothetical protein
MEGTGEVSQALRQRPASSMGCLFLPMASKAQRHCLGSVLRVASLPLTAVSGWLQWTCAPSMGAARVALII